MTNTIDENLEIHKAQDYTDNQQYVNAQFAIGRIETDKGGLTLNRIWEETEWLRQQMLLTPKHKRHVMVEGLYQQMTLRIKDDTQDVERSLMCVMMMFALRLVTASDKKEGHPNGLIISAIVRLLTYKAERDEELKKNLKELYATMDKDGDYYEKMGCPVDMNVDILADDADWNEQLSRILDHYVRKADKHDIVARNRGDEFDAVWEALAKDSLFAQEMRTSSLGRDFNLLLIFNVYGLMYPYFYSTKIRGAQSLAKTVGENPSARSKNKWYSKGYFNVHEIEMMKHAIKTDQLLNHLRKIIKQNQKYET